MPLPERLRLWVLRRRVRWWLRWNDDRRIARAYDRLVDAEARRENSPA